MEWHTEKRKLSELVEWHKNPRKLSEHDAEHIRKSLEKFGIADPLVINLDNTIIGGHQRKRILNLMSDPDYEIDVRVPDRLLDEKEVEELNIRLNKNVGSWEWDILANEFEMEDLLAWGFSEEELMGIDFYDGEKELIELDLNSIEEKPFWVVMRFSISQIPEVMQKMDEVKKLLPDVIIEMSNVG